MCAEELWSHARQAGIASGVCVLDLCSGVRSRTLHHSGSERTQRAASVSVDERLPTPGTRAALTISRARCRELVAVTKPSAAMRP
jgi:hypothetical protein